MYQRKLLLLRFFCLFLQCQMNITRMCEGPPNEALKIWHDSQPNHFRRILVLNGKNYSQKNWLFIRSKYCDFGNLILQIVFVFFEWIFSNYESTVVFFLFFILRRYKFLIYKFTNSTMNINSYANLVRTLIYRAPKLK